MHCTLHCLVFLRKMSSEGVQKWLKEKTSFSSKERRSAAVDDGPHFPGENITTGDVKSQFPGEQISCRGRGVTVSMGTDQLQGKKSFRSKLSR